MAIFKLSMVLKKTRGLDTQCNLSLTVNRETAPIYLSDFNGGEVQLCDGNQTQSPQCLITVSPVDPRRLVLTILSIRELIPQSAHSDTSRPLAEPRREIPLKLEQDISDYVIVWTNWGLN